MADKVKRISLESRLMAKIVGALVAMREAAQAAHDALDASVKQLEQSQQAGAASADARDLLEKQLAAVTQERDNARVSMETANQKLAEAQNHLAELGDEEKLEDHPELVAQLKEVGVEDGEVTDPAAATVENTDPSKTANENVDAGGHPTGTVPGGST